MLRSNIDIQQDIENHTLKIAKSFWKICRHIEYISFDNEEVKPLTIWSLLIKEIINFSPTAYDECFNSYTFESFWTCINAELPSDTKELIKNSKAGKWVLTLLQAALISAADYIAKMFDSISAKYDIEYDDFFDDFVEEMSKSPYLVLSETFWNYMKKKVAFY